MKVIKVGGGCLKGKKNISRIISLIHKRGNGNIFVVSALNGITDFLIHSMKEIRIEEKVIPKVVSHLRAKHLSIAKEIITCPDQLNDFKKELTKTIQKLERLFFGLNFTQEITPRLYDMIVSYGERLSAQLLTAVLKCKGARAKCRMPHKIGLITDGKYNDATANIPLTTQNLEKMLLPVISSKTIIFIPGFYGISEKGDITTFGRGGSDYSAAVIAAATHADILEIWKDVDGFMSADPRWVKGARLIPHLSYEEAAELAYFGAKILHPRSVEPIRLKKMEIAIKNTLNPDGEGSLITHKAVKKNNAIRSVAHTDDIGIIKVHASGVGARPGILAHVAGAIAGCGINIKSVVTSQTCISLLLSRDDLKKGRKLLSNLDPKPFRKLEILDNIALIGIVGDKLHQKKGVAARCFSAVADGDVNVEMIAMGPSKAALYFITRETDLKKAIAAIHSQFFSETLRI